MKDEHNNQAGTDTGFEDRLDSKVIPVMREAVVTVQVVLFGQLKKNLAGSYTEMAPEEYLRLIGCIVNDLFGNPAQDKESIKFARSYIDTVEKEMWAMKDNVPDLLPFITDALRMQTLCDHEEGINSLPTLLRAREFGVLQEERTVPLPSSFMLAVRQLGAKYDLLKPMETKSSSVE